MNAARILSDVSANRAGRLARWIRDVMQAQVGDSTRDVKVYNTSLNYRDTIGFVDFQDFSHARHLNDHASIQRQRSAGQAGAGASRYERNIFPRQDSHYCRSLFSRRGKHHGAWPIFVLW